MGPEVRYARNGDVAVGYAVLGEGPDDLVYLSPFNNLDLAWENPLYLGFLRRLSSFARVVVVDRRGTGVSDRYSPGDLPALEDLVDDLDAVLSALGSERAALFGFSDAGALCAMFAATHPERVSGLILYATAARGRQAPDYPWQWSEQEWQDYLDEVKATWGTREYAEKSLPFFNPSLAGDERMLAWWERFMRLSASPNAIYAQEQVFREMDIRRLLPAIGVPSLVLHRTNDAIEPVGAGRYLAGEIADAEYVELPGADHFPWAGEQDALIDEVERFLTRVRDDEEDALSACWPPSSSPTSWTRPPRRRPWATAAGASCASSTTGSHALSSVASAGVRSSPWATVSWPSSTDGPAGCAAPDPSATRWPGSVSSSAPGCTRVRLSPTATTSPGSPSRSAPA